jgi:hypothetical protein
MRPVAIVLLTALLTLVIAALARAPYTPPRSDDAILRFSWRMSVSARENCRPRTQAELDALPVHMRTPEECTRDVARYVLVTRIDGLPVDTVELFRGGVKGDRPIFVLTERTLAPGLHRVHVDLERLTGAGTEALAALDTTLAMHAGAVQLIVFDPDSGRLTARSSAP